MPTVISGAPGFGIGETRREGLKAIKAKAKTVSAPIYKPAEIQPKYSDSTSIAPAGIRKSAPKRPNWSGTRALALKIISFQTFC